MATPTRVDPYRVFNFRVELGPNTVAAFRECGGLTLTIDPVDYREGADQALTVRKLTGLRKYTNITLKRGLTQNLDLWNWYATGLTDTPTRQSGAIVLQNEDHQDELRWEFENGWITKWEGPALNATGNEVAIESIEICHEGVILKTASQ
jgi:phage tail-like protein